MMQGIARGHHFPAPKLQDPPTLKVFQPSITIFHPHEDDRMLKSVSLEGNLIIIINIFMIVRSVRYCSVSSIVVRPTIYFGDHVVAADNGRHAPFFSDCSTNNPTTSTTVKDEFLRRIAQEHPIVLAQMNYARLLAPMDDDQMKEFAEAMGPINQLAKSTPGFVWSYDAANAAAAATDDDEDDTNDDIRDTVQMLREDPLLQPQLSLWTNMNSLRHFVFKSGHAMYYKRKKEWFSPPTPETTPYSVCWWYDLRNSGTNKNSTDGNTNHSLFHPPTLKEAFDRCDYLRIHGPTEYAFDFATHSKFPMPPCSQP
jgi:hypothetical protein